MERLEDKVRGHDAETEKYREKIAEAANSIQDAWILKVIHDFIIGMTKEGD